MSESAASDRGPHAGGRGPAAGGSRLARTVAFVGLMGAGKTAVGRRVAQAIDAPFHDADDEIAAAAGMSIPEIFQTLGEDSFREGERKVMARLLEGPAHVLATGGGAYMNEETRALMRRRAHTVWLKADLDALAARCARRESQRPLLQSGDMRETLARLMAARYPVYAEADTVVETADGPHSEVVDAVLAALARAGVLR